MNYVVFSIDGVTDVHKLAAFLHFVDVQQAMQRTKGRMQVCIGAYKGELESSFIMSEHDFAQHIEGSEHLVGQESVLLVEDGHHGEMYASLVYLKQGVRSADTTHLGLLKSVDKSVALSKDAWTYRPDLNVYWVTE